MNRLLISICTALPVAAALLAVHAQSPVPPAPPAAQQEGASADARTFSTYCSGCHGSDGRGGERAPNIATTRNIVAMSDDDLQSIVKKGVPGSGMPAFGFLGDQGVNDVVAHLRTLQGKNSAETISGNPIAGRALFFGQVGCSQCHMVKGEGGYIGSDLTDYASGISQDAIQHAITKPDAVLAATSTVMELVLPNGKHISGLARAEDNFAITVQTKDGRWHTFDKSKLASVNHTDHSLHPRDYGTRLTAKELDDIVSYLAVSASNAPPKSGRRRNR